ncbi:O-methyltransferase [Lachnellula subtilissima]|uniref:O-methyltransferase n=1 Tax=Lachnellula subtilissima TaxID=602034 RepID=A0A8H8RZ44_9HELO|nr:O-methyltransferase [Lachnellula subtilissima]
MDQVTSIVKHLSGTADEAARKKILLQLRDLAYSIETPDDTMGRIMFLHLQISGVRVGDDLRIFNLIAEHKDPMTLEQLQAASGADIILLGRLLRYLASIGMIKETEQRTFEATNVTTSLADPGNQAGIRHYFDHVGPQFQKLPSFLLCNGYQNITDRSNTVFQSAWKTDLPVFEWLSQHPEHFDNLNQHMAARRLQMPSWMSVFPFEREAKGWHETDPLFVDIGGGIGHQCAELKAIYPSIKGRVILQDLPHSIEQALSTPGVENMAQDFFLPQPIRGIPPILPYYYCFTYQSPGAKIYYMRGILHDFPDEKCRLILHNVISAMGEASMILIDDMVLPESHANWQATQVDITMMCALASMERTEAQWRTLLATVGLKIADIMVYTPGCHESVILAVRE